MKHLASLARTLALICWFGGIASAEEAAPPPLRALIFSGTGYYRHPDIPLTNGWLVRLGAAHGMQMDVTESPKDFTDQRMAVYQVLIMNNANELDKVLDEPQRKVIEDWYKKGGGIVALHAAIVHQLAWPWFNQLAGCDFNSDGVFQKARVIVDPAAMDDPTVKGFGSEFTYEADWTNHDHPVTGLPGLQVLLRLDESTYTPVRPYFLERGGKPMGADHTAAWKREWDGSRFFYTELGHDLRSLDTPFGRQHVLEGLRWVADKSGKWPVKPAAH